MRRLLTFDIPDLMYHLNITHAHPNMLTAGSRGRVLATAEYLDNPKITAGCLKIRTDENFDRGLATVHGSYKGMPVTAFSSGMGTASVSCTWPEAIEACEKDDINIIRIGTSGGLQPYLKVGDVVISTEIIAQDYTSNRPMDLLAFLAECYATEKTPRGKKMRLLLDRVKEIHPTSQAFAQAIAQLPVGRQYTSLTTMPVQNALEDAAFEFRLSGQQVMVGPANVTADIYANALLMGEREHRELAVSMEQSAINAYRDFYNAADGRHIQTGELLMVSDLVVGEADNMGDFLKRKADFEKMHILSGLEALLRLRQ